MKKPISKQQNLFEGIFSKSKLKQDVYNNSLNAFSILKKMLTKYEIEYNKYAETKGSDKRLMCL